MVALLLACPRPAFALRPQLNRAGLEQALTSPTAGGLEESSAPAMSRDEALAALRRLLDAIPTVSSADELDSHLMDVVHEAMIHRTLSDWEVAHALATLAISATAHGSPHVADVCYELVQGASGFSGRAWFAFFRKYPVPTWQFHPWMARTVMVNNPPLGIHTHPSAVIVQIARRAIHHLGVEIELESSAQTGERISALNATGLLTLAIAHNTRVTLYARSGIGREAVTSEALSLMKQLLSDRATLEEGDLRHYDTAMGAVAELHGARPLDSPSSILVRDWLLGSWRFGEALAVRSHERYADVFWWVMPEMETVSEALAQPVVQRQIALWEAEAMAESTILEEAGPEPSAVPIDDMVAAAREINVALRDAATRPSPAALAAIRRLWLLLRREEIRSHYSDSERWQRQQLVDRIAAAVGLEELNAWPVQPAFQTPPDRSTALLQAA